MEQITILKNVKVMLQMAKRIFDAEHKAGVIVKQVQLLLWQMLFYPGIKIQT